MTCDDCQDIAGPVNVVLIDDKTKTGRARVRTSWATFSFSVGAPGPFLILPLNPKRIRANIIVHGIFGTGPGATSFGWLGANNDVQKATTGGSFGGCAYITPGNTQNIPIVITGENEVWAMLDQAAAAGMTITVSQDVESEQ